jgi:multisubunit Na+/H+ antiporter MnhE subunit
LRIPATSRIACVCREILARSRSAIKGRLLNCRKSIGAYKVWATDPSAANCSFRSCANRRLPLVEILMVRSIFAVVAGFVVWALVATLLNFGLRASLSGYGAAEPTMAFTLTMKIARLILGALASLAAGAAAGLIAPSKTAPRWVLGAIILALFIRCIFNSGQIVALGAALTRSRNRPALGKAAADISRAPAV